MRRLRFGTKLSLLALLTLAPLLLMLAQLLSRQSADLALTRDEIEGVALLAATRVALLCDGAIVRDGPACDVVTPATIRQLYGVEVTAFQSPDGQATAFHPSAPVPPSIRQA